MKGSVVLKRARTKYWWKIFKAWYESEHPILIIHLEDPTKIRLARSAANRFKEYYDHHGDISYFSRGSDFYIVKVHEPKNALEVWLDDEGVFLFYDSTKNLREVSGVLSFDGKD